MTRQKVVYELNTFLFAELAPDLDVSKNAAKKVGRDFKIAELMDLIDGVDGVFSVKVKREAITIVFAPYIFSQQQLDERIVTSLRKFMKIVKDDNMFFPFLKGKKLVIRRDDIELSVS